MFLKNQNIATRVLIERKKLSRTELVIPSKIFT